MVGHLFNVLDGFCIGSAEFSDQGPELCNKGVIQRWELWQACLAQSDEVFHFHLNPVFDQAKFRKEWRERGGGALIAPVKGG